MSWEEIQAMQRESARAIADAIALAQVAEKIREVHSDPEWVAAKGGKWQRRPLLTIVDSGEPSRLLRDVMRELGLVYALLDTGFGECYFVIHKSLANGHCEADPYQRGETNVAWYGIDNILSQAARIIEERLSDEMNSNERLLFFPDDLYTRIILWIAKEAEDEAR